MEAERSLTSAAGQTEAGPQFPMPGWSDRKRTAVEIALDPAALQRKLEERGAERATEVRPSLAPVEAPEGKPPALRAKPLEIDAQLREGLRTGRRHFVVCVCAPARPEPIQREQTIVELDAECAGDVVVAAARGSQADRRRWRERLAWRAGQDAERFERGCDVRAGEA